MFKYTQTYREIEVLTDTSYCFNVYALAIASNTLLTSSCTLHSRKFPTKLSVHTYKFFFID